MLKPPLKLTQAQEHHACCLAPRLKQADLDEIEAARGLPPLTVLKESLVISRQAHAIVRGNDKVIALGGLVRLDDQIGIPWALTSDDIQSYPQAFCKITKQLINQFSQLYPILTNFCDARNTTAIRWLERMGFVQTATIPHYGYAKLTFVQFILIKPE